jgi:CRP/FNR family transcriptional regulator
MKAHALDLVAKLRAISLFHGFDEQRLHSLSEGLNFRRIDAGEVLFHADNSAEQCFLLSYGAVKLQKQMPGGKEVVMCFCRAGGFIGAGVMLNPHPRYPLTAFAVEDSGLLVIPRRIYIEVWQSQPEVAKAINTALMGRMMEFQEDKAMAVTPVPKRVAHFLLRTLDQQSIEMGNRLNLKLSRKDIADRIGTSVESVIRILSQWTQNGWILTEEQRITILHRRSLENLLETE